jgi:hydrophobic/amphiphilic exporter-1 (mainly G- bacteria), HAE1 family
VRVSAPQGVSIDYLASQMREMEALIQPLRDSGEVTGTFSLAGSGGQSNSGFLVMTLAPWHERERSQQEIMGEINQRLQAVPGVRAFAFQPNSLGIRGAGSGLQFAIVGNNYEQLGQAAAAIIEDLENDPRFTAPRLSTDVSQPQLSIEIDRERASDLGIDISGMAEALQAMLDGRQVGEVFIEDRSYAVKLVSTTNPVNDPTDLENIFLQARDGRYVPMSTIATMTERAVPPGLSREQQQRSVAITSSLRDDVALGDALAVAQSIAEPHMPPGSRIVPLAEAATLGETANAMFTIMAFSLVIILLVLAAQFESFVSAVIIIATVPLGLACAVFALLITGTSLNVYSQIGLVLLVGIMAKNGISDRRIRQPAARPRPQRARGDRGSRQHPASARDDDHAVHHRGRRAARPGLRRGRRGACGTWLGHRRRARPCDHLHPLPDARCLSAARAASSRPRWRKPPSWTANWRKRPKRKKACSRPNRHW